MNVKLDSLQFINFKGLKDITITFKDQTNIFGFNRTGKTTIFDGFTWLLFGKDSNDKKDFSIKPLDSNNDALRKVDNEVIGVLYVDGYKNTLRRVFHEKWQKRRGSEEHEFTGNETLYYFNEIPCQAGEYADKVNAIISEDLFKLITNPLYFNSLKWEQRRSVLTKIIGEITDAEIAQTKPEFQALLNELSNKSLDEFKRMIAAKKKKINDDLKGIPIRIDEIHRRMPKEPDYEAIEAEILNNQTDLSDIETKLSDATTISQANLEIIQARQKEVYSLKTKIQKMEFDSLSVLTSGNNKKTLDCSNLKQQIYNLETNYQNTGVQITANEKRIETMANTIALLRSNWESENIKQLIFDENEFNCPTCNREFEAEDIETKKTELTSNFNTDKLKKLATINESGLKLKTDINNLKNQITTDKAKFTELYKDIEKLKVDLKQLEETKVTVPSLESDPEYVKAKDTITGLETVIIASTVTDQTKELKDQKLIIVNKLDNLKAQLTIKATNDKAIARKQELLDSERSLAQQLSDFEKQEFTILNFEKAKMTAIEQKVNERFTYVRFKMFETQINGGEVPCCECLVNGVPWSSGLNNADKINAGIAVINTLCEHYNITAPIFIDNRESVIELLPTESQVINLIVSEPDKELRITY